MFRGKNLYVMGRSIVVVTLLVFVAGCGAKDTPAPSRLSSTAKISIVEPLPGAKISGTEVVVKIALDGGTVLPQASRNLKADEGHIHLKLDGEIITLLGGLEQTVSVTPGPHVIEAEFAASDHGPFNPRVVTTVAFEAE